jgi:hypothetical protein
VAGCCEHSNEPLDIIKSRDFLISSVTVSYSRRTVLHVVSSF